MREIDVRVPELVEHLYQGRIQASVDLALGALSGGHSVEEVIESLLVPAQVEVGERWYRDEWSVADEHRATNACDIALTLLTFGQHPEPLPSAPVVVLLCPQGEEHSLPLRMVSRMVELHGIQTRYLGSSLPSTDLARFLASTKVDAVAISCSSTRVFAPAAQAVQVAHAAGVPVILGGRAFDIEGRRARALGGDLWARTAGDAVRVLARPLPSGLRSPTADSGAALELELRRDELVARVMDRLGSSVATPSADATSVDGLGRNRETAVDLLRSAEAAVLTGDRTVFDEHVAWLGPLLAARGVPDGVLPATLEAIALSCGDVPSLRELLRSPGPA